MDPQKMKILNKINSDRLFKKLKMILIKKIPNVRRRNIIDILVYRFQELTTFDINLFIFNDEGSPVVLLYKKDGKSFSRSFTIQSSMSSKLVKLPKDGKWYRNESFKGYFRHTPGSFGTVDEDVSTMSSDPWGDVNEEVENEINDMEKYMKGYDAGYELGKSGSEYVAPPKDKSNKYKEGYLDGYEIGYAEYKEKEEEKQAEEDAEQALEDITDNNDGSGWESTEPEVSISSSSDNSKESRLISINPNNGKSGDILKVRGESLYEDEEVSFVIDNWGESIGGEYEYIGKLYDVTDEKDKASIIAPFKSRDSSKVTYLEGESRVQLTNFIETGQMYKTMVFKFNKP